MIKPIVAAFTMKKTEKKDAVIPSLLLKLHNPGDAGSYIRP